MSGGALSASCGGGTLGKREPEGGGPQINPIASTKSPARTRMPAPTSPEGQLSPQALMLPAELFSLTEWFIVSGARYETQLTPVFCVKAGWLSPFTVALVVRRLTKP